MEGERERERENDGWINREKEEVEDLYLSILTNQGHNSKVSADIEYYLKSVTNIT